LRQAGTAVLQPPGESTAQAAANKKPAFIRHIHVADNTRVEPGPGSLDFAAGFNALKEIGYAGWVEIECRRLSGRPDEVLPRAANFLRRTWNEA
jgi:sugar phosphate isomerase/epimerase